MSRSERPAHRRGHTRRLLAVPALALAVLVWGVVTLERTAPLVDDATLEALEVEGVPPLGLDDVSTCTRAVLEEVSIEEIRGDFQAGDRLSSDQVYACPGAWDGKPVTYAGEAVGDLLRRDGGAWVQVNDDAYALETGPLLGHRERSGVNTGLAVWLPDGLHERLDGLGRPDQRGTVVLLEGVIHRADPDDGGGTTLRATSLEVLAPATAVSEPLHVAQLITAIVLSALAAAALLYARATRRR